MNRPDFSVADLGALVTLITTDLVEGANVWVESDGAYWTLEKDSGAAPGPTVLAPLAGAPSAGALGARWIRGSGSGGAVPPLNYTVFVGKNGNDATADGSIGKPFLTVQAAMEFAWTTYVQPFGPQPPGPNQYLRPCVFVAAGSYDDGPLVMPPNIGLMGEGIINTLIYGDWSIDARWTNPSGNNDTRAIWSNLAVWGNINVDFGAPIESAQGQLYALFARIVGTVTMTERLTSPVSNSFEVIASEFYGDLIFNGIPVNMENSYVAGTVTLNQLSGNGVDNLFTTSGGSLGQITVNATSNAPDTPAYGCTFGHSVQPGAALIVNGPYSTIQATESSIPLQANVSLLGGATLNQIQRVNQPNFSGLTAARPTSPYVGQQWFDTTVGRPTWWNGASWIEADGTVVP